MFTDNISLQSSPPLRVSIPFFLTALFFVLVFNGIFIFKNINLADRWLPETIGIIHFLNLGFLIMIMIGALTQMLSVLGGVSLPRVLLITRFVYVLIVSGAFFFPFGMIFSKLWMIQIGAVSVWSGLLFFYSVVLLTLKKAIPSTTITSFKISSFSVLIMLVFAARLVWGWAEFGEFSVLRMPLIELHIAWAFFGIAFILIMGVSYKVVPMFYVSDQYPVLLSRLGSKFIFIFLSSWTLIFFTFIWERLIWLQILIPFLQLGISLIIIYFCTETLKRFRNRKRRLVDTTIYYWHLSMILFIIGACLYGISPFLVVNEIISHFATISFAAGVLSLVLGMLLKIIPFLVWLHLTKKNIKSAPTMREMLNDHVARKQFYLHCLTVLFLFLSFYFPSLNYFFSFLLLLSTLVAMFLIGNIIKTYFLLTKRDLIS